MELPDDGPPFPKLPFLVADVVLIGVAFYLGYASGSPLPAAAVFSIAGCVGLGAVLTAIPFIVDYNRRQEAQLNERQEAIAALVRTTAAAAEQASIALGGLHQVVELAQKNLRAAEQLPQKLQEKINDFSHAQDEGLAAELEALQQEVNTLRASEAEKLESAADKIHRTLSELSKLETELRRHPASLDEAARQAEARLKQVLASLTHELETRRRAPPSPAQAGEAPTAESAASTAPAPAGSPASRSLPTDAAPPPPAPVAEGAATPGRIVTSEAPAPASAFASAVAVAPAVRKTPKRRSADHTTDFLPELQPEPAETEVSSAPPARAEVSRPKASKAAESTPAADGTTRLTVTSYIGIGNKLYIRGAGPGLSWDQGVPLQFVSIGKWRWESNRATEPVLVRIFKNDQVECEELGEVRVEPGHHQEVAAHF